MQRTVFGASIVAGLSLVAAQAFAQARPGSAPPRPAPPPATHPASVSSPAPERSVLFGPEVNFATNSVGFGIGGRASFTGLGKALKAPGLGAYASFDYFFPGNSVKWWEINANATYDIPHVTSFRPYVGAGLNYVHTSVSVPGFGSASGSSTGLNLLGGVHFKPAPKLNGFGEVRFELHSGSAVVFTAGLLF